jgi:hypothetical protein
MPKMRNLKIEINLLKLIKLKLTTSQYVILYLLYQGEGIALNGYYTALDYRSFEEDIMYLIQNGYLIEPVMHKDIEGYILSDKSHKIFDKDTSSWYEEFLNHFPKKITRPDGLATILRTAVSACKPKYEKIVSKDKDLHDTIIKALQYEVEQRTRTNSLMYMKTLPKWLTAREWENYIELMQEDSLTKDLGYGTKLI